jgi:RsiW-degrading membrane proteinase PrsW (M82 family)
VLRVIVGIVAVALVLGVVLDRVGRTRWPSIRAHALADDGQGAEAEAIAIAALEARPDDEELLFFLVQNHRRPRSTRPPPDRDQAPVPLPKPPAGAGAWIDEARIDRLLDDTRIPRRTATLARFALDGDADPALEALVRAWAAAEPPVPWANRLLGLAAGAHGDETAAAAFLEREGLRVPGHVEDLDASLLARLAAGDVAGARARLELPEIARRASPRTRFQIALDSRNFPRALRESVRAFYPRPPLGPFLLSAVAALAWLAVCARIGKLRDRPAFRSALYAVSIVLGIASIWPTLWLIHLQEIFLHLRETGEPARDAIFYVFGVGFREELSKLLCFALLVPLLGRRADKLDVLVAGGLVGLGFAAEENVLYLARGDLSTALARYLTANFLHMSMTGLAAAALYDFAREPEKQAYEASKTILLVILLHGGYDFLATQGAGFFAMFVFIILARRYLEALWRAQGRALPGVPAEAIFGVGTAVLIGTSFVWGAARVGSGTAAEAMIGGLIGLVVIVLVFVRTLARL